MAFLEIAVPTVILLVAVAALSLVVASRRDVSELVRDAEVKFDRHRRAHPVEHRGATKRR